jgi:hypothetical protein
LDAQLSQFRSSDTFEETAILEASEARMRLSALEERMEEPKCESAALQSVQAEAQQTVGKVQPEVENHRVMLLELAEGTQTKAESTDALLESVGAALDNAHADRG